MNSRNCKYSVPRNSGQFKRILVSSKEFWSVQRNSGQFKGILVSSKELLSVPRNSEIFVKNQCLQIATLPSLVVNYQCKIDL